MSVLVGSELAKTRSRLGVVAKVGSPEEVEQARREHAEAKLAEQIRRTVEQFPPLTPEACERLSGLLYGGAA